jgi:hypothetical protein
MPVRLSDRQRSTIRATLLANSSGCGGLEVPWNGLTAEQVDDLSDAELAVYNQWISTLAQAADQSSGFRIAATAAVNQGSSAGHGAGTGPGGAGLPPPPPPPAPHRPKSLTEALEQYGTPEERAVWNSAIEVHNRAKGEVIGQLMAHITNEAQRQVVYDYYKDKPIEELRLLLAAQPSAPAANQAPPRLYFGAGGGPPPALAPADEEALLSPVYNWSQDGKKRGA